MSEKQLNRNISSEQDKLLNDEMEIVIAPLCQQAMDLSFDGLIIESHCNPDCAWSDASQQITQIGRAHV